MTLSEFKRLQEKEMMAQREMKKKEFKKQAKKLFTVIDNDVARKNKSIKQIPEKVEKKEV